MSDKAKLEAAARNAVNTTLRVFDVLPRHEHEVEVAVRLVKEVIAGAEWASLNLSQNIASSSISEDQSKLDNEITTESVAIPISEKVVCRNNLSQEEVEGLDVGARIGKNEYIYECPNCSDSWAEVGEASCCPTCGYVPIKVDLERTIKYRSPETLPKASVDEGVVEKLQKFLFKKMDCDCGYEGPDSDHSYDSPMCYRCEMLTIIDETRLKTSHLQTELLNTNQSKGEEK